AQIALFDVVFSIDSVLTAVGMTRHVPIMVVAIVLAVLAMLFFAELLAAFIKAHPTTKALALAFMLLVGVLLVADGLGRHVPRGYVYFALGFSVFVEAVNIRVRAVRARRAESAV
ncbi:MAG: TerC family protein, partial [Planctomycetota bacterium]